MNTLAQQINVRSVICHPVYPLAGMLAFVLSAAVTAQETTAPDAAATATKPLEVKDVHTLPDLLTQERAINEVIQSALAPASGAAAGGKHDLRKLTAGRTVIEVSARSLALQALEKNLSIARQGLRQDIADAALDEARAIFDPVLRAAFNYNVSKDYRRDERVIRFQRATVHCDGSATDSAECARLDPAIFATSQDFIFFSEGGPVTALGFDQPRPERFREKKEKAHDDGLLGHSERYAVNLGLDQLLPWGVSLSMNYEIRYRVADFTVNPDSPDPRAGTYHRPWSVGLNASLNMPLPYTKNFGPFAAAADVNQRIAWLSSDRQVWEVRSIINSTLLEVDLAYWNLVRSAGNLYAASQKLSATQTLLDKTKKMFDLQEITEYSKVQVEAELARVQAEFERTKGDYLRASHALAPLVNVDHATLFVPVAYAAALSSPLEVNPALVEREMVKTNPALLAQAFDIRIAEVLTRQSAVLLRPDVNFFASVSATQNETPFGFHKPQEALNHTWSPDTLVQNYSLSYTLPIGNRALKAGYEQSRHNLRAQELALRRSENTQIRALGDAGVALLSARERVEISRRNWELAQTAYNKAIGQQAVRGVTEFELIEKSSQLLSATNSWVAAIVAAKQAEALWLAARGELVSVYGERTAQTHLDAERVRLLANEQVTPLFTRLDKPAVK